MDECCSLLVVRLDSRQRIFRHVWRRVRHHCWHFWARKSRRTRATATAHQFPVDARLLATRSNILSDDEHSVSDHRQRSSAPLAGSPSSRSLVRPLGLSAAVAGGLHQGGPALHDPARSPQALARRTTFHTVVVTPPNCAGRDKLYSCG